MDRPATDARTDADRRTGIAALTAGVLLAAALGLSLVVDAQRPDLTVTNAPAFAFFLACWIGGAGALVLAVRGLGSGSRTGDLPRAGRVGRRLSLAGACLLTVFGAVHLLTWLSTGTPVEASFWLFLVGFVLLIAGAVPLALGLRRSGGAGGWWATVLVAGGGAVVAVLSQAPWHELGLFTFFGSWAALGLRLLTRGARSGADPAVRGTGIR